MDAKFDKLHATGFSTIEKDSQWTLNTFRIYSLNASTNLSYLKITDGSVSCSGTRISKETLFKVYFGGKANGGDALFESIGDNSNQWMLCVNSQNQLSARKKTKEYINFKDAEEDVLFSIVRCIGNSDQFKIKWKKEDKFIGFDKKGQPIPLGNVQEQEDEALFRST